MDKGIVYCNRVLQGNWYESRTLDEYKFSKFMDQMKSGDMMLARFRNMSKNLNAPVELTKSTTVTFGSKISLMAPHAPSTDPPQEDMTGLLLGGRISSNNIYYSQELVDGCQVVGLTLVKPAARSTFVITSADYCNRDGEALKYNQEFMLKLVSSADKKPLYIRYDIDAIPGLTPMHPVYLSEFPVSNSRWRILPVQSPHITRFELEGTEVPVNKDIVLNHCATNVNLAVSLGAFSLGFHGKICALTMKTSLDVYGREDASNIWKIYAPT